MSLIVFKQTSKVFQPAGDGLVDVTFAVNPAELVLITGPSGAGKTTLLRLLTKEYEPTAGEIFFGDQSLAQIKNRHLHHHRRRIGVVFQDNKLIVDRNVWENVALPLYIVGEKRSVIEQRVADLLTLVGLADKALLFPNQLSGGEAQRVGIARALALAPELIFADEPTGNLDEVTSLNIANLLVKIHQLGTTVLLATHDPVIIKNYIKERVLHLEKGRLAKDSRPVSDTPTQFEVDPTSPKDEANSDKKAEDLKSSQKKSSASSEPSNSTKATETVSTDSDKKSDSEPTATKSILPDSQSSKKSNKK